MKKVISAHHKATKCIDQINVTFRHDHPIVAKIDNRLFLVIKQDENKFALQSVGLLNTASVFYHQYFTTIQNLLDYVFRVQGGEVEVCDDWEEFYTKVIKNEKTN